MPRKPSKAIHIRCSPDFAGWLDIEARRRGYRDANGKPLVQNVIEEALTALADRDGIPPPPRRRWATRKPTKAKSRWHAYGDVAHAKLRQSAAEIG